MYLGLMGYGPYHQYGSSPLGPAVICPYGANVGQFLNTKTVIFHYINRPTFNPMGQMTAGRELP
jgi:hypothetical protein